MVEALPFRGLRFDPAVTGDWGALLGPPYDVTTPAQQEALRAASRYQITRVESPGAGGAAAAAATLDEWREAGALKREAEPAYYLARQRFRHRGATHSRTTLFVALRLEPWNAAHPDGGSTKPHEWTMPGPKEQRTTLRATTRADISPLMVFAPDASGGLAAALARLDGVQPTVEGADPSGESHELVVVEDEIAIAAIREALAGESLYMADGHHRYESALGHREQRSRRAGMTWQGDEPENYVLAGVVRAEDPGLIVGATHRLLHWSPTAEAQAALGEAFEVRIVGAGGGVAALEAALAALPEGEVAIGVHGLTDDDLLLVATEATRRSLPPEMPASWGGLGPAVLQFAALAPVFGVDEEALRQGEAVSYEHDAAAAFAAVEGGQASVAFLLQAPTLAQIFQAADAGDRMPQKSTYFVPKLPTGVVVYAFDAGDDELF